MSQILIIEDNPANLDLMVYLLKAYHYTTLVARDGLEGLEMARRERPDLILLDVHMPRMDGYTVARHLKSDPGLRHVPLVAVTAMAMVGDREKVLAAGFDGYLSKPVNPETFLEEVGAFLRPEEQPASQQAAPAPWSQEGLSRATHRASILAVDNSPVNLRLVQSILEPSGYHVVPATNVAEALKLAHQTPPDLILSDVHMPHENGFDFIRLVKADPRLREIPFLFISSTTFLKSDESNALSLGAVKFITRPIDPTDLLAELEACLPARK